MPFGAPLTPNRVTVSAPTCRDQHSDLAQLDRGAVRVASEPAGAPLHPKRDSCRERKPEQSGRREGVAREEYGDRRRATCDRDVSPLRVIAEAAAGALGAGIRKAA